MEYPCHTLYEVITWLSPVQMDALPLLREEEVVSTSSTLPMRYRRQPPLTITAWRGEARLGKARQG